MISHFVHADSRSPLPLMLEEWTRSYAQLTFQAYGSLGVRPPKKHSWLSFPAVPGFVPTRVPSPIERAQRIAQTWGWADWRGAPRTWDLRGLASAKGPPRLVPRGPSGLMAASAKWETVVSQVMDVGTEVRVANVSRG